MPRPKRPDFEPRLALHRHARRMTQEDVASELGISVEMVRRHERGAAFPGYQHRRQYVRIYGVPESDLWLRSDAPTGAQPSGRVGATSIASAVVEGLEST